MAKKDKSAEPTTPKPKKRRWYQNLYDAYNVVKRTYKWIPIALIALPILLIGLGILLSLTWGNAVLVMISAVMGAIALDMTVLALLLRPAMYQQLDGKVGAVYSVISQIKRGWVVEEEPVTVSKSQDVIWRLVGRPGVVLISEGPPNRVKPMLNTERQRITRAISNVPIIFIEVGHEDGQIPLKKLSGRLRKQKKLLTKQEVPAVANRLRALGSRALPVPKGIDPYKAKSSRKALRG